VCGKARSNETPATVERERTSERAAPRSRPTRLEPFRFASARSTWRATPGLAPVTSIELTPKRLVSRAITSASRVPASAAKESRSTRPEGTSRPSSRRSPGSMRGNGTTTLAVRARGRSRPARPLVATGPTSAPAPVFLEGERAEEDDLVLEVDAELLAGPAPGLAHQREAVGARGVAGVLDEVRVAGRHDRAEGPLVRRLRRLAARDEVGDLRLDLLDGSRHEAVLDPGDDLVGTHRRVAVPEPERLGGQPTAPLARDHEGADEDRAPVGVVRAG